jgi:hypothetical protein
LDAWWREVGYPSRRAGVRGAIEAAVARHHANEQRSRQQTADPHRWQRPQTSDRASDAGSTPITAGLHGAF